MSFWSYLTRPLLSENPVSVQILGLCAALAVSTSLLPALFMSASVIVVLAFSNCTISLLRHQLPNSIRLILEITIIASAVIVVNEALKTWVPETAEILSLFVSLIVTNCIILGRAESFALHHPPLASLADALGNGMGFAGVLLIIAAVREVLGNGSLLGIELQVTTDQGGWFQPNQLMQLAPSACFLLGLLVWGVRFATRSRAQEQSHQQEYRATRP